MADFPAMPLYTDAYLGDTGHLLTIEHGAYLLMLITAWRNGGWLPNDDKYISRITRMTIGQWERIKPTVIDFWHVDGDRLYQKKLTEVLGAVKQVSHRQSKKARDKWLRIKEERDAAAESGISRTDAYQNQNQNQNQKEQEEDTADAVSSSSANGKAYAFEARHIRLTASDFERWQISYSHLNLRAELEALDDWAGKQGKRWFPAVAGALAKRDREIAGRKTSHEQANKAEAEMTEEERKEAERKKLWRGIV